MSATEVTGRRLGRYVLLDLVAESGGVQLWRAQDETLDRPVGLRLIPASDPAAQTVRTAACAAATVDDRRLVRVLDVFDMSGMVGVVTEWVQGRSLADVLEERHGDPLTTAEAMAVTREVGRALQAGHAAGVVHGRLRPAAVLVTDAGEVRVRGLGVDAALWGVVPPGYDGALAGRADVHGLGSVLYAGLTGRWPDGLADGLPAAPRSGSRLLPPSHVVADVPAALDEVVCRSVVGAVPPRGQGPYDDVADVLAALGVAAGRVSAAPTPKPRRRGHRTWRLLGRLAAVLLVLAAVAGLGLLGWQLINSGASPWTTSPEPLASGALTATAGPAPTAAVGVEATLPIAAVSDFDPYGGDRTENPEQAGLAVDDDPTTAWTTVRYKTAELSGKPGTGLLVDLGGSRPVSAVTLGLVGNGTDVEVRVADQRLDDPEAWRLLAAVNGAGSDIMLRSPRPVAGRYVLVWFTRLPTVDGSYQGGIRDVVVRG